MTALQAFPADVLDASAYEFIATFMTHVAMLSGHGKQRLETIAGIRTLLVAAIAHGDSGKWCTVYRAISDLVDSSIYLHDTRTASTYLRAFIHENGDLERSS